MYKISINKDLFDSILLKKIVILEKENSNYWKKELLEPQIIDDKLTYKIRQFNKILLTNGLGKDKPQLVIECNKVDYSIENSCFKFHLGKIIEQKNTTVTENDKDNLIKQLMEEREILLKQLREKQSING
uniref:hypothetical protein n=1 Tax=Aliarcobacter sp. TaxID=2321116 RepID=UPI004048DC1B